MVSYETALALKDLGDLMPAKVHLTVPPGFRKRTASAVLHAGRLPSEDIEEMEGFRVTTAERAVLDCAPTLSTDYLAGVLRDGLRRGVIVRSHLLARLANVPADVARRIHLALTEADARERTA